MPISSSTTGLRPGVCTSTTRPTAPYEGQMIYETDTNRVLIYDNTAWVMIADTDQPPGLQFITSSSATSGTSLSVNNCFTSTYESYVLHIVGLPTSGTYGIDIRMRASGSDTNSGYYWGMSRVDIAANTISVDRGNNSSVMATGAIAGTAGRASAVVQVINPQLAQYTSFSSQSTDNRGSAGYGALNCGGQLTNTTQYDGFSLMFGGGSGTISYLEASVYGYRK